MIFQSISKRFTAFLTMVFVSMIFFAFPTQVQGEDLDAFFQKTYSQAKDVDFSDASDGMALIQAANLMSLGTQVGLDPKNRKESLIKVRDQKNDIHDTVTNIAHYQNVRISNRAFTGPELEQFIYHLVERGAFGVYEQKTWGNPMFGPFGADPLERYDPFDSYKERRSAKEIQETFYKTITADIPDIVIELEYHTILC